MGKSIHGAYSQVHRNYDTVNTVFSFGTMNLWRKITAQKALNGNDDLKILDVGTGTGELAFDILKAAKKASKKITVIGMDFNVKMLEVAQEKARKRKFDVKFEFGDAANLRYQSNTFDVVTSGFAIKNIHHSKRFSTEAYRVLKKGGRFIFLEMGRPEGRLEKIFITNYWKAMSKTSAFFGRGAYIEIIKSINDFDKNGFVNTLKKAGFKNIVTRRLVIGPAFIIIGEK